MSRTLTVTAPTPCRLAKCSEYGKEGDITGADGDHGGEVPECLVGQRPVGRRERLGRGREEVLQRPPDFRVAAAEPDHGNLGNDDVDAGEDVPVPEGIGLRLSEACEVTDLLAAVPDGGYGS